MSTPPTYSHVVEVDGPHRTVYLAGQTGVDWLQTPDGRPGWAYNFLDMGYVVYLEDFPARGRSQYVPGVDGTNENLNLNIRTANNLEEIFTASALLVAIAKPTHSPIDLSGGPHFVMWYRRCGRFLERPSDHEPARQVRREPERREIELLEVDLALGEAGVDLGYGWAPDHNAPGALGVSPYAITLPTIES
jgi:hypothetical protein